jgi:D-beta-D-heptose 7-phosphate kinase/D-beta-D-heptose 1-phosphate adenosyltransferase
LTGYRVLVVGDVMLDEYLIGDTRRVSPEAPVPVVGVTHRFAVPGGAGNAATNVAALGGRLILGGVMGDDLPAKELCRTLEESGIDSTALIAIPGRPTTSKLRVLVRDQQVLRVDTESTAALSPGPAGELARWAEEALAASDAVLLSDYGKGVVDAVLTARVIEGACRRGRPVVVDPKGGGHTRYRGATLVKPNLCELADLTGRPARTTADILTAGQWLAHELCGTAILVTRGTDGMCLFRSGRMARGLPAASAKQVYDVTGAGDTVAAALALALAAGFPVELAARVANVAGGIVVQKSGTAVVTPTELHTALQGVVPDFIPFAI